MRQRSFVVLGAKVAQELFGAANPIGTRVRVGGERYRVFTTRFDQVEDAANLCDPEELGRLRLQLDRQLAHLQGVVSRLANLAPPVDGVTTAIDDAGVLTADALRGKLRGPLA